MGQGTVVYVDPDRLHLHPPPQAPERNRCVEAQRPYNEKMPSGAGHRLPGGAEIEISEKYIYDYGAHRESQQGPQAEKIFLKFDLFVFYGVFQ